MDLKSKLGYSRNSPFKHLPEIKIKGNNITMAKTDIDLYGTPIYKDGSKGKPVLMKAGRKEPYIFKDAVAVLERPVKKFKKGGIAVFGYSHLMNPSNVKKILDKSVKLSEHHLDGFKKTKDKSGETVIKPDNTSTTKGVKFYVTNKDLSKLDNKMKPYTRKQIGGDSTYSKLFTYYNNGGEMKKFTFTKKYQQGGKNKTGIGFAVEKNGKLSPAIHIKPEGVQILQSVENTDLIPVEYTLDERGNPLKAVKSKKLNQGQLVPIKSKQEYIQFARKLQELTQNSQKKYQAGGVSPNANMVLLDHTGNPQMYMEGGELIISRKETKKIIDLAQSAETEEGLYELGKYVYSVRMKQRERDGY